MAPGYSIGAVNGYDPYMLQALSSYNVNFQGAQQATQTQPQVQYVQADSTSTANLPKADYSKSGSDLTTGLLVAGTIATGAFALYKAYKKGDGSIINGVKKYWNQWFQSSADDVARAATNAADNAADSAARNVGKLENIKIAMENGKPVYYIPGKAKPLNTSEIRDFIKENPRLAQQLKAFNFNSGNSVLNKATFNYNHNGTPCSITFDGDKINQIKFKLTGGTEIDLIDSYGKIRTDLSGDAQAFAEKIDDLVYKLKNNDAETFKMLKNDLTNVTYTTTIGDHIAKIERSNWMSKPEDWKVQELTTLKKLSPDKDKERKIIRAYIERQKGEGNDISVLLNKEFTDGKKIPQGYKIGEFDINVKGKNLHIVDGKVYSFATGDHASDDYITFVADNKQRIEKAIKDAMNKIEKGDKNMWLGLSNITIVPV